MTPLDLAPVMKIKPQFKKRGIFIVDADFSEEECVFGMTDSDRYVHFWHYFISLK